MFMPCSTKERYYTRFSSLANFFVKFWEVHSGLDYVIFTKERECKHTAKQRDKVDESSNYIISNAVKGKKIIICDDLLTTGKSLSSYSKELKNSGAEVVGAIFLAKTVRLPSNTKVIWKFWAQFFFHKFIKYLKS